MVMVYDPAKYDPVKASVTNKRYRAAHRDEINQRMKKWYQENRESILEKYHNCEDKEVKLAYKKEQRRQQRQTAIEMLGGACVRCGFSDPRALQIDHINGGGAAEAKLIGTAGALNKVLRGEIDDYQLLCANCNWIKRVENNEVPAPYRGCPSF